MCTHNLCFVQNKKNINFFLLKIFIFYNFKNLCKLHGRVFVMSLKSQVPKPAYLNSFLHMNVNVMKKIVHISQLVLIWFGYE